MDKDKNLLIRQVTQMEGWRILKDRWQEQLEHNKSEVSNLLRKPSPEAFLKATQLQGRVDGVDFVLRDVDRLLSEKEEDNPNY